MSKLKLATSSETVTSGEVVRVNVGENVSLTALRMGYQISVGQQLVVGLTEGGAWVVLAVRTFNYPT